MKKNKHWTERLLDLQRGEFNKIDKITESIGNQFALASMEIADNLEELYAKYAEDNRLTIKEAKKIIPTEELERIKRNLGRITDAVALEPSYQKELDNFNNLHRISVLRAQHTQLKALVEELYQKTEAEVLEGLANGYSRTYYKSIYRIQKELGEGIAFARLNEDAIFKVLTKPWKGSYFSERWRKSKNDLVEELTTAMNKAFFQGRSKDYVISEFKKRMEVSTYRASRIILTEHSYICGDASASAYSATGVDKYQFIATLDGRTSEVCRHMDNKIVDFKDREVGVNYPPLHCFCRSTTIPYIKGLDKRMKRVARDSDGNTYEVPANMDYNTWYRKHVLGEDIPEDIETKEEDQDDEEELGAAPFDYAKYKRVQRADLEKEGDRIFSIMDPDDATASSRYVASGTSFEMNRYLYTGKYKENYDKFKPIIEKTSGGKEFSMQDRIALEEEYGPGIVLHQHIDAFSKLVKKGVIPEDMVVIRNVDKDFLPTIFKQANIELGELSQLVDKAADHNFGNYYFKEYLARKKKFLVEELNKKLSGVKYTNESFMSTSFNAEDNYFTIRPIQLEIYLDKGTTGYVTQNWEESEIVLDKGTTLEILETDIDKVGLKGILKIKARITKK